MSDKQVKPLKSLSNDDSAMVCGPNGCSIADHQKLVAVKKAAQHKADQQK